MEAKADEQVDWACNICSLSVPHMHVHKVVLCSSCDYLRALFQSGMQERCLHVIVTIYSKFLITRELALKGLDSTFSLKRGNLLKWK